MVYRRGFNAHPCWAGLESAEGGKNSKLDIQKTSKNNLKKKPSKLLLTKYLQKETDNKISSFN